MSALKDETGQIRACMETGVPPSSFAVKVCSEA